MDDGTAVVLASSIPAALALAGVVWQARKTRDKGTEEHKMARAMLEEQGAQLSDIQADVRDVKADVRDLKAADRQHDADIAQQGADIAQLRKDMPA